MNWFLTYKKALDYLTDFHVEYDEANPKRCKVTAVS
jgi:hypothetical protein